MKPPKHNSLDRLLRAARRRWIVRRAFDAAAVGASVACGVSLLLIAILWWQAESSLNLIAGLIACGALLGVLMSLIARPSSMQTAKRLDAHHNLHDLLATAQYLIEARRDDEAMQVEIIRHANYVADGLRLMPMMFARLTPATQTAIVGLVGLTLTFAAIASSHVERNAKLSAEERSNGRSPLAASRKETSEKGTQENRNPAPVSNDIRSRSTSDDTSQFDGAGNAVSPSESRDGNAFAKSDATQKSMTISPKANAVGSIDQGISSSGGAEGNVGSDSARPGAAASTKTAGGQVDLSSQSRDAALKLLNNGGVPDAYRDLVRDYFLRD